MSNFERLPPEEQRAIDALITRERLRESREPERYPRLQRIMETLSGVAPFDINDLRNSAHQPEAMQRLQEQVAGAFINPAMSDYKEGIMRSYRDALNELVRQSDGVSADRGGNLSLPDVSNEPSVPRRR